MMFFETQLKMPFMVLPVRSILLEVMSKKILISPGSQLTAENYQKMGEVTDLVAPNLFHCGGIAKAKRFFPNARVWGIKGVKEVKPDIFWDKILGEDPWEFNEQLPILLIEGMPKVNEVVFYDKSSRSLIVTDLCFNIKNPKGIGSWLILKIFGTYNKFAISRFYIKFISDRLAFNQSIKKIFLWNFEKIIVSHGDNVLENGPEFLNKALLERKL
ncbi:MAG: DUF4336 domain-containing protein [Bdellovibrionaceae bacterium]|nr:DUF4336 domain-containing protein [Pseudobdellovibrionaceae bacterium]